jgi:mannose-6-phosphate isomerase
VLYPLTFHPILKERVWGGRKLEQLYRKPVPPGQPTGESWEITDRPGDVSVVANGPLAGKDLRWIMEHHERELLGDAPSQNGRFPLLIKILDAQEKLSLQVHPPAANAAKLGGEPKTEMWFVTDADANADLYVGLKQGVTRAEFERKLTDGEVARCFHRISVQAGDAMFLPSGRVHAIGAGLVLFEVQQNSDTTYRVFDWNRAGLDGKPRELHVAQSLASIDFTDFEPALVSAPITISGPCRTRELVRSLFSVDWHHAEETAAVPLSASRFSVVGVVEGRARVNSPGHSVDLAPGNFCLIPAASRDAELRLEKGASVLVARS